MGVTSCGKSGLDAAFSERLNIPFPDAEDFLTAGNILKILGGAPLEDEDLWPWLEILGKTLKA